MLILEHLKNATCFDHYSDHLQLPEDDQNNDPNMLERFLSVLILTF